MPDRPSRLKHFKQWSQSHEHLLSFPRFHNLIPWRSAVLSKPSTDNEHRAPRLHQSTGTLQSLVTSSVTPTRSERLDEVPAEAGFGKRVRSRLQNGLRLFLRPPSARVRFSSMDTLPTSSSVSVALPPPSIQTPQSVCESIETPDLCCRPQLDSWLSVNEQVFELNNTKLTPKQTLPISSDSKIFNGTGQLKSSSTATLTTVPERTRVKFEMNSLKIPIRPSDVEGNPPSDVSIHVKRLLGQGANGFCHEVHVEPIARSEVKRWNSIQTSALPQRCTLKIIPSNTYRRKREAIHREISVQKRVSHPNLLKLYMAYHDSRLQAVCLLLEFCALGSLLDVVGAERITARTSRYLDTTGCSTPVDTNQPGFLRPGQSHLYNPETGGLTETLARHIFRGLMRALDHLHERLLIVHRDIKPSNIMLAEGWQTKLSDFGLACTVSQCLYDKSICGTPNYLAPEVFLREGHSRAADCWAAGATLYYMLCARAPFQPTTEEQGTVGVHDMDSAKRIPSSPVTPTSPTAQPVSSQVRSICRCLLLGRYEFPASVNQSARLVITKLLQRSTKARPTAAEVLRMDFCSQQSETFETWTRSDSKKLLNRPRLILLQPKRTIVERLRRARSFGGLNQRACESMVQQALSTDGPKRLALTERLLQLRRTASDRARHWHSASWTNLRERIHPTSVKIQHNPVDRQFFPSRTPSPNIQGSVGNIAFTGNEAIRDIFKLLAVRAKSPGSDQPEVFHWISRWALTSDSLLYYTLGHVMVDTQTAASPARVGPVMQDSWGVTNLAGYGIACHETRTVRFERKHNVQFRTATDLPSHTDVQSHCEFLSKQLKRFNPLQDQPLLEVPGASTAQSDSVEPVFVERWQEHGNNVIFLLSTGGWQVNFHNHSKLIVHYPHMLLSCDARRQSKEPGYANSVEMSTENLDLEFNRWLDRHPQLDHILQILLFMLL